MSNRSVLTVVGPPKYQTVVIAVALDGQDRIVGGEHRTHLITVCQDEKEAQAAAIAAATVGPWAAVAVCRVIDCFQLRGVRNGSLE